MCLQPNAMGHTEADQWFYSLWSGVRLWRLNSTSPTGIAQNQISFQIRMSWATAANSSPELFEALLLLVYDYKTSASSHDDFVVWGHLSLTVHYPATVYDSTTNVLFSYAIHVTLCFVRWGGKERVILFVEMLITKMVAAVSLHFGKYERSYLWLSEISQIHDG